MRDDAAAVVNAKNPFLWREAPAARAACRNSAVHHEAALQQILDHADETLLLGPVAVRARFQKDCDDGDGDAMVEGDNDSGDDKNKGTTNAVWVSGKVVIASKHLYFWWVPTMRAEDGDDGPAASSSLSETKEDDKNSRNNNHNVDLRISAYHINLHALLADDDDVAGTTVANEESGGTGTPSAVYLQISGSADEAWHSEDDDDNNVDDSDDDDGGSEEQLFELTLKHIKTGATTGAAAVSDDIQQPCQQLFDAISKMVALNPIDPNTDETGEEDGAFGGGDASHGGVGCWITSDNANLDAASIMAMMGAGPEHGDGASDDDLICCAPVTTSEAGEVEEDERNAMLERLDNLLIVPPEYEINDDDVGDDIEVGQFDDADEDDEIL